MVVIQSVGQLETMREPWWPKINYGSVKLYDQYNYDYATLYKSQPNVRTCVDFLARNIAQLGLHVFKRVGETDRQRLRDHPLALLIAQPLLPEFKVTRYRLIESLVGDLGVYFNAFWLKVRGQDRLQLLRVPPQYMEVSGRLVATKYQIDLGTEKKTLDPNDVVHFRGYNAESAIQGLSPLETLRRILAEEHSAGDYREHFWQNAARQHGIIERPKDAPEWSQTARARFKAEFEALYAGGENSGKTAILEEGMTWKAGTFNAQESEYLAGRKLTREECARAYHIPLPMVGILDHATFSNIKEQHKNLYQDSLGPWLAMIEEEIGLQLLPEFEDRDGVYVEFNIAEKLQGSFEEQVKAYQSSVGAPYMTRNEARARMNLPRVEDPGADRLVIPLNVLVGGQASPRDATPDTRARELTTKDLDVYNADLRQRHEEQWRRVLARHYRRQEAALAGRVSGRDGQIKVDLGGVWYDEERWDSELYADLLPLNRSTALDWAGRTVEALDQEIEQEQLEERVLPWLQEHSRVQAEYMNDYTRDQLAEALRDPEPKDAVKRLFEAAISVWAVREAASAVTTALNFGAVEGAAVSGLQFKTWQVNSTNPRDEHAALNGTRVGIRQRFPNGMRWPGDPAGGAENNAYCQCTVRFS